MNVKKKLTIFRLKKKVLRKYLVFKSLSKVTFLLSEKKKYENMIKLIYLTNDRY